MIALEASVFDVGTTRLWRCEVYLVTAPPACQSLISCTHASREVYAHSAVYCLAAVTSVCLNGTLFLSTDLGNKAVVIGSLACGVPA